VGGAAHAPARVARHARAAHGDRRRVGRLVTSHRVGVSLHVARRAGPLVERGASSGGWAAATRARSDRAAARARARRASAAWRTCSRSSMAGTRTPSSRPTCCPRPDAFGSEAHRPGESPVAGGGTAFVAVAGLRPLAVRLVRGLRGRSPRRCRLGVAARAPAAGPRQDSRSSSRTAGGSSHATSVVRGGSSRGSRARSATRASSRDHRPADRRRRRRGICGRRLPGVRRVPEGDRPAGPVERGMPPIVEDWGSPHLDRDCRAPALTGVRRPRWSSSPHDRPEGGSRPPVPSVLRGNSFYLVDDNHLYRRPLGLKLQSQPLD
jgi:hypothetical protein